VKITSRPAPKPVFDAIEVVIRIESREEMNAMQQLCRISQERDQSFYPVLAKLAEDLLPHVTPL
jgi:hypothetical protein